MASFEVVERKFRGHPDSLADMVAQKFMQLYIKECWKMFPKLSRRFYPNFSADKVMLSGASTTFKEGDVKVIKPIHALLVGKITQKIGRQEIPVEKIFRKAIEEVFSKCLGHNDYMPYLETIKYVANYAGVDHNKNFYNPNSVEELLGMLKKESLANDTVYVVAYSPLSVAEKMSIYLDNLLASSIFKKKYPEIGSDIKVMIRRRNFFEITICLPVYPEKVFSDKKYRVILKSASIYLKENIYKFLATQKKFSNFKVKLFVNTKDTRERKYYAVWGTALSKGDIGAVGRGNRQQGFISGLRPSTNEAISGKNPNHFAGLIYQTIAEKISLGIYNKLAMHNIIYITSNNGDSLSKPASVDIILGDQHQGAKVKNQITSIVEETLGDFRNISKKFIDMCPYERFMCHTDK